MKALAASLGMVVGALVAGAACGPRPVVPPATPSAQPPYQSPLGVPRSLQEPHGCTSLLVDLSDLQLGTTAQFSRLPTRKDVEDLSFVRGLNHVVVLLDEWPEDISALQALQVMPLGVDLTVVLTGYPPSRAAVEAWNQARTAARVIVVADGPPDPGLVYDLNAMGALMRVIVDTQDPSRIGFEHLQRPIQFRKIME